MPSVSVMPTPDAKDMDDPQIPELGRDDSGIIDSTRRDFFMKLAGKKNFFGKPYMTVNSMALKMLLAARDGEVDGEEVNTIFDSVKTIYDVILVATTLIFSMMLNFCFADGRITPDPWLSGGAGRALQQAFVILSAITSMLFLSTMLVITQTYFQMLLLVTTNDKIWFLTHTEPFASFKFMIVGFFGLMCTMIVGVVLSHGVVGLISAGISMVLFWGTAGPHILKTITGVNARIDGAGRAEVMSYYKKAM